MTNIVMLGAVFAARVTARSEMKYAGGWSELPEGLHAFRVTAAIRPVIGLLAMRGESRIIF